jgi:hypothetical protein
LAEVFTRDGCDVTVLHVRDEQNRVNCARTGGTHLTLPLVPGLKFEHARQHTINSYLAYLWLRDHDFEFIHFPEERGVAFYSVIAKHQGLAFPNATLYVHAHGPTAWLKYKQSKYTHWVGDLELDFMERESVALADAVISPSTYLLDWMETQGWRFPVRRHVMCYPGAGTGETVARSAPPARIAEVVYVCGPGDTQGLKLFCDAIDRSGGDGNRNVPVTVLAVGGNAPHTESSVYFRKRSERWKRKSALQGVQNLAEAIRYLSAPGRLAVLAS